MLGTIHVVLAIIAIAVGATMFLLKKGGRSHRTLGYLYSVALLLVNLSALSVYQDSEGLGPFHILALVSLVTLGAGILPAFFRKPKTAWMPRHAYFMSWSYIGLIAAGAGQLATTISEFPGVVAVGVPSIVIVLIGGAVIHARVPEALVLPGRGMQPDRHPKSAAP